MTTETREVFNLQVAFKKKILTCKELELFKLLIKPQSKLRVIL